MPDDPSARSAYQPGEAVWVFVLGTWQPAIVIGRGDTGTVLVRYRHLNGELSERRFAASAVMESTAR
jgi:hypothetical protein